MTRFRPVDVVVLLVLLAALLVRVQLAAHAPYIHDEENASIPLSKAISFEPGRRHLPLRGENHPALPAYVVKGSSALFGTTPLGYRSLNIAAGLCTVVIVYFIARQWYGPLAGLWAAALLAFNEYFLGVSSRATAHAPHLLLMVIAIFVFSRFLARPRAVWLYTAAAAVGLAFYCKEHSALILPVFMLSLLPAAYRRWFRTPHVYLACAVFALVIAPDIAWNVAKSPDTPQASYANHLQRIGGLGFSPYPSMFLARAPVQKWYGAVTGQIPKDETPEYASINPAIGALLFGTAVLVTFWPTERNQLRRFLLVLFWGIFGFFTLIQPGDPPHRLDPVSWIWVDVTMIPAVIIAGAWLAGTSGMLRVATWTFAGAALLYSSLRMLM